MSEMSAAASHLTLLLGPDRGRAVRAAIRDARALLDDVEKLLDQPGGNAYAGPGLALRATGDVRDAMVAVEERVTAALADLEATGAYPDTVWLTGSEADVWVAGTGERVR